MNKQGLRQLRNKVEAAVHMFLANDAELLTLAGGIHEQTISHRIAVYLEPLFHGYHVDCEYNKHGGYSENRKMIENIASICRNCKCKSCKDRTRKSLSNNQNVKIRPDIIIHKKRGEKGIGNVLAIEIKKKGECLFDQEKITAMTDNKGDFKYRLGVCIWFIKGNPEYRWFKNRKIIFREKN